MSLSKSQFRVNLTGNHTSEPIAAGGLVTLDRDESHRIRDVLRMKVGHELSLISESDGRAFLAVISTLSPAVTLKIIREESLRVSRSKTGILACALIKGERNDWLCEKACELGAQHLIFWQSAHSVVKLDAKGAESKKARYSKIISSSSRQSANFSPPQITILRDARELVDFVPANQSDRALTLFCSLAPDADSIKDVLIPARITNIVTGPEGDFSEEEEKLFRDAGWKPVSLGPLVLRAETAALAALSAVNAICGFSEKLS